jgi:hypothetical protein
MSSLLPKLMKLGRAGSRSDCACEETNRQLDRIIPGIEMFRRGGDSGLAANEMMTSSAHPGNLERSPSITENETTTESQPSSGVFSEGVLLIEPPKLKTKGKSFGSKRKSGVEADDEGNPFSTYDKENCGDREWSGCHVRGSHYITTCSLNPNRSSAYEMRLNKKRAKKQNVGGPQKRGRPKKGKYLDEENDPQGNEMAETQSSCETEGVQGVSRSVTRSSARRVARVNYEE